MHAAINDIVPSFDKQETGAKVSLNWNTLANFWKSTFWFYYLVHISSKSLFL